MEFCQLVLRNGVWGWGGIWMSVQNELWSSKSSMTRHYSKPNFTLWPWQCCWQKVCFMENTWKERRRVCVNFVIIRKQQEGCARTMHPSFKHISSLSLWLDLGFVFSATDNVQALTFCMRFQNNIWREGGRQLSLNLPFSLHCARVFVTVRQSQSRPNPNLPLVKISHFSFLPILSKLSTAEQSALLDLICRRFSRSIPGSQSLDYTIKIYIFAFQSLSPHQSTNMQHTHSDLWQWAKKLKVRLLKACARTRRLNANCRWLACCSFTPRRSSSSCLCFLFSGCFLWMWRLIRSSHELHCCKVSSQSFLHQGFLLRSRHALVASPGPSHPQEQSVTAHSHRGAASLLSYSRKVQEVESWFPLRWMRLSFCWLVKGKLGPLEEYQVKMSWTNS